MMTDYIKLLMEKLNLDTNITLNDICIKKLKCLLNGYCFYQRADGSYELKSAGITVIGDSFTPYEQVFAHLICSLLSTKARIAQVKEIVETYAVRPQTDKYQEAKNAFCTYIQEFFNEDYKQALQDPVLARDCFDPFDADATEFKYCLAVLKNVKQRIRYIEHANTELVKYFDIMEHDILSEIKATTLGKNCIEYYAILSSTIVNKFNELKEENNKLRQQLKERESHE